MGAVQAKIKDTQGPHVLRVHLQIVRIRAKTIQPKPNGLKAGTEHVVFPLTDGMTKSGRQGASL
jgi:hypothetical protein